MSIKADLLKQIKGITKAGLPIMEGREKGDASDLINEVVLVNNFDFGTGDDGSEYVVFTIRDNDTEFFFGSSIVTENFKELTKLLTNEDELHDLLETGLEMSLHQKKSAKNRLYTYNTFFPSVI